MDISVKYLLLLFMVSLTIETCLCENEENTITEKIVLSRERPWIDMVTMAGNNAIIQCNVTYPLVENHANVVIYLDGVCENEQKTSDGDSTKTKRSVADNSTVVDESSCPYPPKVDSSFVEKDKNFVVSLDPQMVRNGCQVLNGKYDCQWTRAIRTEKLKQRLGIGLFYCGEPVEIEISMALTNVTQVERCIVHEDTDNSAQSGGFSIWLILGVMLALTAIQERA